MNNNQIFPIVSLMAATFLFTGCSHGLTSPERHAHHFAYTADDGFDPNFGTNKTETAKLSLPFFQQFWQLGKKDKEANVSREGAIKRAEYLGSDEFLRSLGQEKEQFAGRSYIRTNAMSPKKRKALVQGITASYMDGYEGRL